MDKIGVEKEKTTMEETVSSAVGIREKTQVVMGKIKESILLLTFNIVMPLVDIGSDMYMIQRLLINGLPKFAGLLVVPFLMNYFLSWNMWRRLEKNRRFLWIPALLNCYPQYSAAKVICAFWTDPKVALKRKKMLEREMAEMEVFAEAVITLFVMQFLMVKGHQGELSPGSTGALIVGEKYYDQESQTMYISRDYYLFTASYSISVLTASIGLAKSLKTGPCRILAEGGAVGGYATGRFLLLTIGIGCTLVGKGGPMAWAFQVGGPACQLLSVVAMFGPGLLLAIFSMCRYHQSLRDILWHPSLLLLPVFTFFTFRASREDRQVRVAFSKPNQSKVMVTFSKAYTLANMALSFGGYVLYITISPAIEEDFYGPGLQQMPETPATFPGLFPAPISGLLLTLLYLLLDSFPCCPCSPCCPALQRTVMLPEDPLVEYVRITLGERRYVVIPIF